MASDHARYLASSEDLALKDGHTELPDTPGFTGATLADRADAHRLDFRRYWVAEGVSGGDAAAAVLNEHLATVYHRSALLSPAARFAAFSIAQGASSHAVVNVMTSIDVADVSAVLFPAPDARDVPSSFTASGERPNPVPGASQLGYPISAHLPRVWRDDRTEPRVVVDTFTLCDTAAGPVDTLLISTATDADVVPSDAFLVPRAPLAASRTYEAHVVLRYDDALFERRWRFTTRAAP